MSDGPHKTLKMSSKWRALAKLAGNPAHSAEEVAEGIPVALASDWQKIQPNFLHQMRAALGDDDNGLLLPLVAIREVQRLRAHATNSMEALLADCAQDVLRDSHWGTTAFAEAVACTLAERADRGLRQIEEHYRREASPGQATHIRGRLIDSVTRTNLLVLASSFVSGASSYKAVVADRSGLDVGVRL